MKVALVHDYLGEFGGAERVLLALSEIWPKAPIYTAFYRKELAWERFKDRDIRVSWVHYVPFFNTKLHSPLRFLAPLIWRSFDFTGYDIVISSASWYVTKGFGSRKKPIEICYCHTPPRYLYGYPTSVNWQKSWPVRLYAAVVNHFMRIYDFNSAQRVDYFIANSEEVAGRIKKFYKREATVIYPPVDLARGPVAGFLPASARSKVVAKATKSLRAVGSPSTRTTPRFSYYLIVSRIVGSKGLELAVRAANITGFKLKIVGMAGGYGKELERLKKIGGKNVEFLGFVEDSELAELYKNAKGFLALAQDEDFGITPVEAMMAGTPVVAFRGGGYVESVVQNKTGIFFNESTADSLVSALKQFDKVKWDRVVIAKYAQKFSKQRFKREILDFVNSKFKLQSSNF